MKTQLHLLFVSKFFFSHWSILTHLYHQFKPNLPTCFIGLLLLGILPTQAQVNNDCSNAINVCDNTSVSGNSNGFGVDEFPFGTGCLIGGEHQSSWYSIQISDASPSNASLTFVIDPISLDDYDFAVFGPNANCGSLGSPIRCSFAAGSGNTGLQAGAGENSEGAGGNGFVNALTVQPGQTYYILIDNWSSSNQGFNLNWGGTADLNCNLCNFDLFAGDDTAICPGASNFILNASVTNNTTPVTYTWTANPSSALTYLSSTTVGQPTVNATAIIAAGIASDITYTLEASSVTEGTCADDVVVGVINLSNPPSTNSNVIYCQGSPLTALTATPNSGGQINWYNVDPSINPAASSIAVGNTFLPTTSVNTNTLGTTPLWITESGGNCESAPVAISIQVILGPGVLSTNQTYFACAGGIIPTMTVNNPTGAPVNWYTVNPEVNPAVVPVGMGDSFTPSSTVINTNITGTYNFWAVASVGTCSSPALYVGLTIAASITAPTATSPTTICAGETIPTLTASAGVNALNWYNADPDTGGLVVANSSSYTPSLDNMIGGTYTFWVAANNGNCTSAAIPLTIAITPPITTDFIIDPPDLCIGETAIITYTGTASPAANYIWNFGGGSPPISSSVGPHNVTWSNEGNISISLAVDENGCFSSPGTQTLTVSAPPEDPIISCQSSLDGVTFSWNAITNADSYNLIVNGNLPPINTTDNSYSLNGLPQGVIVNISVEAVGEDNCGNSNIVNATCEVLSCMPIAIDIPPISDICLSDVLVPTILTATPTGGVWIGNGILDPINGSFDPGLANVGTHTLTYTYTEGDCVYQDSISIVVHDQPDASFLADFTTVCINEPITLTYIGGASSASTFTWDVAGATPNNITGSGPHSITWANSGSFTVSLTIVDENGCISNEFSQIITVEMPLLPPSITCISDLNSITFSWTTVLNATGYNIGTDNNPFTINDTTYTVTGLSQGEMVTFSVEALGMGSCGNAMVVSETCETLDCVANPIVIPPVSDICLAPFNVPMNLNATPIGGTWSGTGIIDPSNGTFDVGVANIGTHTISYTYQDMDCIYQDSINIVIHDIPTADFDLPELFCIDETGNNATTLNYTGSASDLAAYTWNFGGATTVGNNGNNSFDLSFPSTGTYTMNLQVEENGCISDLFEQTIEVGAILEIPTLNCENITSESITFSWQAILGASDYEVSISLNGNTFSFPMSTDGATSYVANNLEENQTIAINVVAIADANGICGNSQIGTTSCTTLDCPDDFVISIDNVVAAYCSNEPIFALQATPTGGTFTGEGIVGDVTTGFQFDASLVQNETLTLLYEYTNPVSNCFYSTSVNTSIVPFLDNLNVVCGTATPNSVTFEWVDLDVSGYEIVTVIDENPGEFQILTTNSLTIDNLAPEAEVSLTISAIGNEPCANSPFETLSCNALPCPNIEPQWVDLPSTLCTNEEAFALNAIPTGGLFFINSDQSNIFDPTELGVGTHDLIYAYTDTTTSCVYQLIDFINVGNPLVAPVITCDNSTLSSLTFNWLDVGTDLYDISISINGESNGGGDIIVGYSFTVNDLTLGDEVSISVTPIGNDACAFGEMGTQTCNALDCPDISPTIEGLADSYCSNEEPVSLILAPSGGILEGEGVSENVFNPSTVTSTTGNVVLLYTYTDETSGCEFQTTATTQVSSPLATPIVTCSDVTTGSITFEWGSVTEATGYEVNYSIGDEMIAETTSENSVFIDNLAEGETITYTVIAIGIVPCGDSESGSETCTTLICPNITPTFTNLASSYCNTDAPFVLEATPTGGIFSGEGLTNMTTFDPSLITGNNTTLTYQYTDPTTACIFDTTVMVNILTPLTTPEITCSDVGINELTFTWGEQGDGMYEVALFVNGSLTISETINSNSYTLDNLEALDEVDIEVIVLSDNACGNSPLGTQTCTTSACPTMDFVLENWNDTYCATDDTAYDWMISPTGGTWSGAGINGTTFTPADVNSNTANLTYSYTNPETNCFADTTLTVFLIPPLATPVVTCGESTVNSITFNWTDLAVNNYECVLTFPDGSSSTEIVSGTSYTQTGLSEGDVLLINIVALANEGNPCENSAAGTTTCIASDCPQLAEPVQITNLDAEYCGDAAVLTLEATPTGGVFSGEGVNNGQFDPSLAMGDVVIVYEYEELETGCVYQTTATTQITAPATLSNLTCNANTPNQAVFTWEASNATEFLVTTWVNDVENSTVNVIATSFTVDDLVENDEVMIEVLALGTLPCTNNPVASTTCTTTACPDVSLAITNLETEYCATNTLIDLIATPVGGLFSGDGIVGNQFNPSLVTGTTATITYTYTDEATTCSYSEDFTTAIFAPIPLVEITCTNVSPNTMTFNWTDVGVANYEVSVLVNNLPFSSELIGETTLALNNLSAESNISVTVTPVGELPCGNGESVEQTCQTEPCPVQELTFNNLADTYCSSDTSFALEATPTGGVFSGNGVVGNQFDPSLVTAENTLLTYTFLDMNTNCSYEITQNVAIQTALETPNLICEMVTLNSLTFSWNDVGVAQYELTYTILGSSTTEILNTTSFTLNNLPEGTNVEAELVAINETICSNSDISASACTTLDCPEIPLIIEGLVEVYCEDAVSIPLNLSPTGGTLSGNGVVENSFNPSLAGIGTHTLTYTWSDGANCNYETTTSVEVQALPTAQIALSADTICLGESLTASVAGLANENATFQWQLEGENVGNTAEINLSSFALGGVYDLNLIIESEACTYQVASNIFVGDISLVLDSLPTPISLGDAVTLTATAHSNLDFALNLDWFNETSDELLCADCPALTISPNETSIYTLLATDTQGCITTLSTTVSVLLPNRVVIPNAFSPNGDGKNDLFRIQGINIVSVDWFIYDRWGYQIAALPNVSATEGWDGQRDGVKVEIGTYIYHVVVYFEDGIVQPVSGHVSLIR